MKISRSRLWLGAAIILSSLSGCIVIPYPHDQYPHSNISGRVVDSGSGIPLKGVEVRLAGDVVQTDANGAFKFEAKKQRHYFVLLYLVPLDIFNRCRDELAINSYSPIADKYYRSLTVGVKSCRASIMVGDNDYLKNPTIFEDVGTIGLIADSSH